MNELVLGRRALLRAAAVSGAGFGLAQALPGGPPQPGRRSSVDKVYAVTNFEQASIFASAPSPVGPGSASPSGVNRRRASAA